VLQANVSPDLVFVQAMAKAAESGVPPSPAIEMLKAGEHAALPVVVGGSDLTGLTVTTGPGGTIEGTFVRDAGVTQALPSNLQIESRALHAGADRERSRREMIIGKRLIISCVLSMIACGGQASEPEPAGDEQELGVTQKIPLGSAELVRSSGSSRPLARLTLEANHRFRAEMKVEGRDGTFWAPASSEIKVVSGSYRLSRDNPSAVDPDQRVRDGIWLEYEDPSYSYDHFSYEWRAPKLTFTRLDARLELQSDPDYRPEPEPAPIVIACNSDRGAATARLTLDKNRNQRGTLKLTKARMAGFPDSQSVDVGYDDRLSTPERARFRGMRGEQGFDITVPRAALAGSRDEFSSSLTYEADQGGSATSFGLRCQRD
jgi:hypothetical protein